MTTIPSNLLRFAATKPEAEDPTSTTQAAITTPPIYRPETPDEFRGLTPLARAQELMQLKGKDLPIAAKAYANYLCQELGGCMETLLTAYSAYAELFEGCISDDPAYGSTPGHLHWLETQGYRLPDSLLQTEVGKRAQHLLDQYARLPLGASRNFIIPSGLAAFIYEHGSEVISPSFTYLVFAGTLLEFGGSVFIPVQNYAFLPDGKTLTWWAERHKEQGGEMQLKMVADIFAHDLGGGQVAREVRGQHLQIQIQAAAPAPAANFSQLQGQTLPSSEEQLATEATQQVVDYLNSVWKDDPQATRFLLAQAVPANVALTDHPHVVTSTHAGYDALTALGLLNGALTTIGLKRVASKWGAERKDDGSFEFQGFQIYNG